MIIIYEIPILLIVMLVLGVLGIGMQYINTIVIVCVITYALFEMFWVYGVLHSSKENMLKKKNIGRQRVKRIWFSMYICALFRVLVITIALFLSLKGEATRITEGSFFDMLFAWGDGIFTYLIVLLCTCVSWGISINIGGNAFDGYGADLTNKRVVLFNIFQILSSVAVGALMILG